MSVKKPPVPKGTQAAGRKLWNSVVENYELEDHELALLREAVRTLDHLDALYAAVEADGVIVGSSQGDRANPALVEARQQRITLARLLAALRVPSPDDDERLQRRVGVRGVYEGNLR